MYPLWRYFSKFNNINNFSEDYPIVKCFLNDLSPRDLKRFDSQSALYCFT